jgi:hypothetical protein
MIKKLPCEIRQYSDMEKCEKCGLCWDMNDPNSPECKMYNDQRHEEKRTPQNAIKAAIFCAIVVVLLICLSYA